MKNHSAVIPFQFESKEVRVLKDESDNPWWVAKDVCDVLDHSNHNVAVKALDDDERGVRKVYPPHMPKGQDVVVISESGLYTLIIRSNKPEAKKFRKWVTSEVLPAIRKTGAYQIQDQTLTSAQQRQVQVTIAEKVYAATGSIKSNRIVTSAHFQTIHRAIKNQFLVPSYKDIPSSRFNELIDFIMDCPIEAPKQIGALPNAIDENAIAVRISDAILHQVKPQIVYYEKAEDIQSLMVDLLTQMKSDIICEIKKEISTPIHIPDEFNKNQTLVSVYAKLDRQRKAAEEIRKEVWEIAGSITSAVKAIKYNNMSSHM